MTPPAATLWLCRIWKPSSSMLWTVGVTFQLAVEEDEVNVIDDWTSSSRLRNMTAAPVAMVAVCDELGLLASRLTRPDSRTAPMPFHAVAGLDRDMDIDFAQLT